MLEEIPRIGEDVKYNGDRYIAVNRRAKVGEKVVVVMDFCYGKRGEIHEVTEDSDIYHAYVTDRADLMNYDRCLVLEPLESTSPQSDRDLIIELAYTVAKLERRVKDLEKRELTHAYNIEKLHDLFMETDDKAEMLIDDVVMLDERTQPLTDDGAKEFAEGLSDVIEEYVNDRITRDQIRRAYD